MNVFVLMQVAQSGHHALFIMIVEFVFHYAAFFSASFFGFVLVFFSAFFSRSINFTFEMWIGPSRSAILPLGLSCDLRKCFLMMRTPSISTRCLLWITARIFP